MANFTSNTYQMKREREQIFGEIFLLLTGGKSIIREKSGIIYFPGVIGMKQVHLRVDDELYNELITYSATTAQTMQDCV